MKFKGKVALVTGSARGIGRAIALGFAKEGARVIVNYVEHENEAKEVVKKIVELGSEAIAIKADVSKESEVKRLVNEAIEKFGEIDVLVNNAGIIVWKPSVEVSSEEMHRIFEVNFFGTFYTCREVLKRMRKIKKGRIVNIASIVGVTGSVSASCYAASKAAVIGITKSLALEYAKEGITVNAVAPGYVATDLTKEALKIRREQILKLHPVGRVGEVEEVASAVLFLASDEAGFITGETLLVSGGRGIG